MPVEVPVFIDIEQRATATIGRAAQRIVREQTRGLSTAVVNREFGVAHRIVDQINLRPAIEEVRSKLELLALNAVLLGAAQFTEGHDARRTRFVLDREVPFEVAMGVEQIVSSLAGSGTEQIRLEAKNILAEAELVDPTAMFGVSEFQLFKQVGLTLVGKALASALNGAVDAKTQIQSTVAANLLTSRMAAFGALSQAKTGGITTYQWNAVLDSRTCPICRGMHGKVFSVGPALRELSSILTSQDPNVARALSPWPKQTIASINRLAGQSNAKLQAQGFSKTPAHPRCRCVLSIVGTVPRSQIKGFLIRSLPPAQQAAGAQEFGVILPPSVLDIEEPL